MLYMQSLGSINRDIQDELLEGDRASVVCCRVVGKKCHVSYAEYTAKPWNLRTVCFSLK